MSSCLAVEATLEDLQRMVPEELLALVLQLRGIVAAQVQAIEEISDERNAALLLNELCHY